MNKYEIYYLKVKKGYATLIKEVIKGYYITISMNKILIDNNFIANCEEVHSIDWIDKNGYKQLIEINPSGKITVE